jgi:hypothetical protein
MDDRQRAERMADEDDRAIGLARMLCDPGDPIIEIRLVPVGLFDAPRGGKLLFPTRVPMAGTAAAEAGRNENVEIGRLQRLCLSGNGVEGIFGYGSRRVNRLACLEDFACFRRFLFQRSAAHSAFC